MGNFCIAPFLEGYAASAGLIIAIGAQNAFVLKQGILKNHVFITALLCAVLDALLIGLGVGGFESLLAANAILLTCAKWGGAAFLFYYGFRSFRAVFRSVSLELDASRRAPGFQETIVTILALTLLNPHAYLDTVILLGSISAQVPAPERLFFALGAVLASFMWFFTVSYVARFLAPLFRNPLSWKILDFLVGCTMWGIALALLLGNSGCLYECVMTS